MAFWSSNCDRGVPNGALKTFTAPCGDQQAKGGSEKDDRAEPKPEGKPGDAQAEAKPDTQESKSSSKDGTGQPKDGASEHRLRATGLELHGQHLETVHADAHLHRIAPRRERERIAQRRRQHEPFRGAPVESGFDRPTADQDVAGRRSAERTQLAHVG